MATTVKNPFIPMRVPGKDGAPTVEELSRVQDLIKTALDVFARNVTTIVTTIVNSVTGTGVLALTGPAVVYTNDAGELQVDTDGFVYDRTARSLAIGNDAPQAQLHVSGAATMVRGLVQNTQANGIASVALANDVGLEALGVDLTARMYYTGNAYVGDAPTNTMVFHVPNPGIPPSGGHGWQWRMQELLVASIPYSGDSSIFIHEIRVDRLSDSGGRAGYRMRNNGGVTAELFLTGTTNSLYGASRVVLEYAGPAIINTTSTTVSSLAAGGLVKAAAGTGLLGIGVAGTDYVAPARAINTTAPLTGGGNLTADRTLGVTDFVASGASHARGTVPDPGASAGTTKFLREDATWAVPSGSGVPTTRVINATSPIRIDGGASADLSADRTLSHANTAVTPGSYTYASLTVDAMGHLTAASSGTAPVTSVSGAAGRVTSTGGTTPVIDLATTAVTPGSYTYASLTVDAYGRLTAASSGTAPVTSVSGTAGRISSTGGTTPTLDLVTTAVTPGSYTYASLTVDAYGRLTAASNGATPQPLITWPAVNTILISSGTSTVPVGDSKFTFDYVSHILTLASGTVQNWYNVDGTDYERVRAFWSGNVFSFKSEAGGAGTVRPIEINGNGGGAYLHDSVVVGVYTAFGTAPDIVVQPTEVALRTQKTIASASGALWDAILVGGSPTITGTTTITAPFAQTKFQQNSVGGTGPVTISDAATLYIQGPPFGTGGVTIANGYALWIDSGDLRLDGFAAPSGANTPVFANTPGAPTQAGWIFINSDGTRYRIPAFNI